MMFTDNSDATQVEGLADLPYAVAEISVGVGGAITVHRVTAVVDCGTAADPAGVRAQVRSAVVTA